MIHAEPAGSTAEAPASAAPGAAVKANAIKAQGATLAASIVSRAPALRRRTAEATLSVAVEREGIFILEGFIDSLAFATQAERSRLKLAGSEIFDNLVKHSSPVEGGMVTLRASRRAGTLFLIFAFKSSTFSEYASRCYDYEPAFDHRARRWRGMGLRMTRNLSSDLRFRAGSLLDRVLIRF